MQMGDVAMGKLDKYNGCILKSKDDMDKIVQEMYTCNGIIVGVPTYDLTPSSLYLKFAQRFLAYELSFLLEIGAVKEDPHMVGGLIAVGGSCHDWQTLALEGMGATMFTQSVQVVDQMLSTRNGRPGNVLLRDEQIERAHKMGENIIKAINTPVEERGWLGDPDQGMCEMSFRTDLQKATNIGMVLSSIRMCSLWCRWRSGKRREWRVQICTC